MSKIKTAECSDTGRVRTLNEDFTASFESPNGLVLVVCDGMGGQNAGEVASEMAVSVIRDILMDNVFPTPGEAITMSVMAANRAILNRAGTSAGLQGMGTTCVILIVKDDKVYYGSVGDSRIYYYHDGSLRQITKDQSYVQSLVDAGTITAEEAEHHQDKNQITNALGIEGMTPPVLGPEPIIPSPGDVFLLCSDGLSNMVGTPGITNILGNDGEPLQKRAHLLVEEANKAGGHDNITVQLVEFGCQEEGACPNGAKVTREIKRNRILTVVLGCLTLLILAGAICYFIFRDDEPKTDEKAAVKKEQTSEKPSTSGKTQPSRQVVKKEVVIVEEKVVKSPKKSGSQAGKKSGKTKDKAGDKAAKKIVEKADDKPKLEDKIINQEKPESGEPVRIGNYAGEK